MKPRIAGALLALMAILLVAGAIALFLPFVDCPGTTKLMPPILSERMRRQHLLLKCPDCTGSGRVTLVRYWALKPQPSLPHDREILAGFRGKSSVEKCKAFDSLRISAIQENRDLALEMILLGLSDEELDRIGIHVSGFDHGMWVFAYAYDDTPCQAAIESSLRRAGIKDYLCWCGHGMAGWSVSKRDFVRARRALLEDREVLVQGVVVLSPRLSLGP